MTWVDHVTDVNDEVEASSNTDLQYAWVKLKESAPTDRAVLKLIVKPRH